MSDPAVFRRALAAAMLLAFTAALPLFADGWHGEGHANGTVADVDGKPLVGATVTLRLAEENSGPPAAVTDAR